MMHAHTGPVRARRRRSLAAATAVALLGVLGACGTEQSGSATDPAADPSSSSSTESSPTPSDAASTSTATPVPKSGPPCAKVWVADRKLSRGYRGCMEGDTFVEAEVSQCSSGQALVTYADRFYAAKGERINDEGSLKTSKAYQRVRNTCFG